MSLGQPSSWRPRLWPCQDVRERPNLPPRLAQVNCAAGNGGITLPEGFCAVVVADSVGRARHIDVAANGDVFLALNNSRGPNRAPLPGGVALLRDLDGDGDADEIHRFGDNGGNEVLLTGNALWFATDDAVLRYRLSPRIHCPGRGPGHRCERPSQRSEPPGQEPGPRHERGALSSTSGLPPTPARNNPGVSGRRESTLVPNWRTGPASGVSTRLGPGNKQADGARFATGLRNTVALRIHPSGALFGVVHGRDQLSALWPDLVHRGRERGKAR